jgi:hypothetical protein
VGARSASGRRLNREGVGTGAFIKGVPREGAQE